MPNVLDTKLDRAFTMLDADGDGALVSDDLTTLAGKLAAAFGLVGSPKATRLHDAFALIWEQDLRHMDADGNGSIDPAEFRDGMRRAADGEHRAAFLTRLNEMVAAWMDIADTDGNGVVDLDEFTTMYTHTLGADPGDLATAFARLDLDGNGSLDADEIRRATEEYYTSESPDAPGNWLFGAL
ncbi:EF-hand domain-containing protein [Streptomyces fractus]|uniref:EF-hand domain-containing protein n=1 Tax=Streptomyces fractus TaxID=641806 RepID=UPI003CF00A88